MPATSACRRASGGTTCFTAERYQWLIGRNYVRLEPGLQPAHLVRVEI